MEKQQHLKTKQNKKESLVVYGNNITQFVTIIPEICIGLKPLKHLKNLRFALWHLRKTTSTIQKDDFIYVIL